MKNLLKSPIIPFASLLAVMLLFSGCSINDSNTTTSEELTEEELEVAGQIIAESLSDQKDGIFASLNDAFTLPSSNGFNQSVQASKVYSSAVFNAAASSESSSSESNYNYTYNPSSGKHLVSFSRSTNRPDFSKESSAELEYIYLNNIGDFIASPRIENEKIETIDYIGTRSGSIVSSSQNSSYKREDQFMIQGLTSGTEILIDGLHTGSGSFKATREDGTEIERDYELTVEFMDVAINNSTVETNGTLEKGITGALVYEMLITKIVNGVESMKTVNGTIEFNGDGTALLRFRNILDDFKIQLGNGDLLDDDEFNGFVESADHGEGTFKLVKEDKIYLLAGDVEFSADSDLDNLEDVDKTINNNIRVSASGRFIEDDAGTNLVQFVNFNYESEDTEFEDNVNIEDMDIDEGFFKLENGLVLKIDDENVIQDKNNGLTSLEAVQTALEAGNMIEAEGEFEPTTDGTNIVSSVSFEFDEQDFESYLEILTVTDESLTLVLGDGKTYVTNGDTRFEFDDDDITSIEQLQTLFQSGRVIKAEGEYYFENNDDETRTVLEIEFESEEFEEYEFEGVVTDVSSDGGEQMVTIKDELDEVIEFFLTTDTKYEDDDIQSFNQLATEFTAGEIIEAEVEYYVDSSGSEDRNIVAKAEFEIEDDNEGGEEERVAIEFEDTLIDDVDPSNKTITLEGNLVLLVDEDSEFDDGDIKSLGELHGALTSGLTAEADGKYYTEDGNNVIIEIDFDLSGNRGNGDNDDDDSDDGDEDSDDDGDGSDDMDGEDFYGEVSAIDQINNTFTVDNLTFEFPGADIIDEESEITTFTQLVEAFENQDLTVEADGEYYIDSDDNIILLEVDFEIEGNRNEDDDDNGEDDSDDDGDGSDDMDGEDFYGEVSAIDQINNTFTVGNLTFEFPGADIIDEDSEITTFDQLVDAFNNPDLTVEADGEYYIDSDDNIILLEVDFEIEGNRDEDDDDNGEDDSDDDGDGSDDMDGEDFYGEVTIDENASGQTFTVDGLRFDFPDSDKIDDDSEITKYSQLVEEVSKEDQTVIADGEYYTDADGNYVLISVEFEIEGNRDEDDDSGDSNDDDDGDNGDDDSGDSSDDDDSDNGDDDDDDDDDSDNSDDDDNDDDEDDD